jgi:hypothetical protein
MGANTATVHLLTSLSGEIDRTLLTLGADLRTLDAL